MDDNLIVGLFWQRDESAIAQTRSKYGNYCYSIAFRILGNREDAEECENDTYLAVWRDIPPAKPICFQGYLGAISRRIALDRWRRMHAKKRGCGEFALSFEELEGCVANGWDIREELAVEEIAKILSAFLRSLPEVECNVFLRRYWYSDSVKEIAKRFGFGESKVKMMLKRTREKLLIRLREEDVFV